ncbi:MAG: YkgJ family cysteine cluster protein [Candidatus Bathyarchaeia archaeon]|jgi:Fe-S-cluster containining protein
MIESFYLHLQFKTKKETGSINLPFLCDKCGVCCTLDDFLTAGQIKVTPTENPELYAMLRKIYEEMGKQWEEDPIKYDRYITHTPCPFLKDKQCSIYEVRPEGCRKFPNTHFGKLTKDCRALNRFTKQANALSKDRVVKKTYHTTTEPIIKTELSKKQYQDCIIKLKTSGITEDEINFFTSLNQKC